MFLEQHIHIDGLKHTKWMNCEAWTSEPHIPMESAMELAGASYVQHGNSSP